ncbi:hypothetical protein CLAFUW4_00563 [Fulvia fulva]|uniref:Uncharacterized protein n=1 Tax=Passalora fulva TaxID=5499 RepID=A0A9Q8L7T3_PASFU|nr:uncharacterized protein CLAFUR5_00562 [Fulvia fulva]KAK4634028.1 hypothetical protein CLAFUR4_00564 [Fulvia fulva]KAK4637589.1 hypothetical protein CLAFUR0_00565 [Fulvia fulva]UJO12371.1 hypothetical protein CLAFUR5_00562 [Fulvia fulva]WPV08528.1 hypothetical protein CLAFUW4_00563 [Fulvia fulva]WPV24865.1 hypothetical protein CLAFUW7_00568 [Fulvia fulva]
MVELQIRSFPHYRTARQIAVDELIDISGLVLICRYHYSDNCLRLFHFQTISLAFGKQIAVYSRPSTTNHIQTIITMPRQVAPPPSGEFNIKLVKPFSGPATHSVEVTGEPNRPAVVRVSRYDGDNKSSEKSGDVPKDDVNELMNLVNQLRGFPSHPSKDVYGFDTKLELNTFEIQWANEDDDAAAGDVAQETKDGFKRIADSIDALGRTFAKQDSAV